MEGDGEGSSDRREEEALLLKTLSETRYKSRDIPSALKYALRALRIFPSLLGIQTLLSSLRILAHSHTNSPTPSPPDYYGILQLQPFSDIEAVRRQYKRLALALHPDKNPNFVCQDAFKVVGEALRVLSDAEEKERYDLGLRVRMQEEGLRQGGGACVEGENRFWSACRECGKLHEFNKGYLGKRLVCSGCGKSFRAIVVGEEAGGGSDSASEATDEDAGIMDVTEDSSGKYGCDGAVRGGDIIYVRKRKGCANKVEEIDATRKPISNAGGGYGRGWGIWAKKVKTDGMDASNGEGAERGFNTDDEEEGFWDLKLKDGLSIGKKAEVSRGSILKSKVSVVVDVPSKDGEKQKVRSRDVRREAKSGEKHTLRDVEEKKTVVVIGLRCMADEDRLKIAKSSAKARSEEHQSSEVDMGGGNGEWGVSRQRSTRVQVKSAGESRQLSDEKDDASGEEVMTLSEMRSRLIQKVTSDKEKTNYKEKRTEKENEREKVGAKGAVVEDENDHERAEEQLNNDRDVDDENEYEKDGKEKEMDKTGEVEERAGWMDEERDAEIEKMNDHEDEGDQQKDLENEKEKGKEEEVVVASKMSANGNENGEQEAERDAEIEKMNDHEDEGDQQKDLENEKEKGKEEVVVVASKMSANGNENGEHEADVTGFRSSNQDETLEHGTWGYGDIVEGTATDTRWTKRIRCYETKRRALLKRSQDSRVEILGTSGPMVIRPSSDMESPITTKSRSPRHLNSSNSNFYDFDKDRGERNFKKGQVWAIYDEFGQPRRYGLIDEVKSTNPFAVCLRRLAKQETKGQDPAASCASCGRFKVTTSALVKSVGVFSHEVDGERVAKEMYDIYPKKGSVWAIYEGSKRYERYDIVVCLTSYVEMFGLSLAYLEKMGGFMTVYKRKEIGWDAVRWLGKDEVVLLSHQIPARRISREDDSDFEEDSWVLDPASISPRIRLPTV